LKCNTGKVCNCLIQFLLTMVLSIEECVFIRAQQLSKRTVFPPTLQHSSTFSQSTVFNILIFYKMMMCVLIPTLMCSCALHTGPI
jgi:hypothetical protein